MRLTLNITVRNSTGGQVWAASKYGYRSRHNLIYAHETNAAEEHHRHGRSAGSRAIPTGKTAMFTISRR